MSIIKLRILTNVKHHTFLDGRVGYTSYAITKESQIVRVICHECINLPKIMKDSFIALTGHLMSLSQKSNETLVHTYSKTKVSVKIYVFTYVVILLYKYRNGLWPMQYVFLIRSSAGGKKYVTRRSRVTYFLPPA